MTVTEGMSQYQQAQNARMDEARKSDAYNALRSVYGPGAGALQNFLAAQNTSAAETSNLTAEAGYKNALTPGAGEAQAAHTGLETAQTGEAQARSTGQEQQNRVAILGQHVNKANSLLAPDGSNASDVWGAVGPQLKADLGLDDATYAQMGDMFQKDPHGELARATGMLPKPGVGFVNGQPAFTTENPLTGTPQPAQTNVSPVIKTAGAPQNYIDEKGRNHTVTFDENGGAREGTQYIGQVPSGWKPLRQEAINVQNYSADTRRGALTGVVPGEPGVGGAAPPQPGGAAPPQPGGAAPPGGAPQAAPVEGSGDTRAVPPNSPVARFTPGTKQYTMSRDAAKQATNAADAIAQARPIIKQALQLIGPYTTGAGARLKDLPGSVQNDLNNALATIQANEFITATGSMKNSQGQTGMGRFLQAEVPMFQKAYGSLAQDQTTTALAQHLNLVTQFLDHAAGNAVQGYKANFGANPYDVLGVKPYAPTMSTPATGAPREGSTATNPKTGAKVTFTDGKWVGAK